MLELFTQADLLTRCARGGAAIAAVLSLCSLLAILLGSRSTLLRALAILALLAADMANTTAVWGTWQERRAVEASVAGQKRGQAERARWTGYTHSRQRAAEALTWTAGSILVAAIALGVAGRRRLSEDHSSPPMAPLVPGSLIFIALATVGVGAFFWKGSIPARALDETGWRVLALRDAIEADEWSACLSTDLKIEASSPARSMRELSDSRAKCTKHFTSGAGKDVGRAELERLLAARWFDDVDQRKLVEQAVAKLTPPEPPPAAPPPPPPDPALAEAKSRASACYPKPRRRHVAPSTPLDVDVTVSPQGKITNLTVAAPPGRNGKAVRSCLLKALRGLTFAPGEQRTVAIAVAPAS